MTTHEQTMTALALANEVRAARRAMRRAIAGGALSAADVILSPPQHCERVKVSDVLISQPQWGKIRTARFCRRHLITTFRRLDGLTSRQRQAMAAELS